MIERDDVRKQAVEAVAADGQLPPGRTHRATSRRVGEQLRDAVGKLRGVAGRCHKAYVIVRNHVADPADIRTDCGASAGEAFNQRNGCAFVARRQQENIGSGVQNVEVAPPTEKTYAIGDFERLCARLEGASQLAVAGNQENHRRVPLRDPLSGIEKKVMVFNGGEPADGCHDVCAGSNVEADARPGTRLVIDCAESTELESQWYDAGTGRAVRCGSGPRARLARAPRPPRADRLRGLAAARCR